MKFIKSIGNELGIFIAISSRNNFKSVESAINDLSEAIFPLKNQIDFKKASSKIATKAREFYFNNI